MNDLFHKLPDGAKAAGDLVSITMLVGSLASWLPAAASILTILWTLIRIYETSTVQRLLGKGDKP